MDIILSLNGHAKPFTIMYFVASLIFICAFSNNPRTLMQSLLFITDAWVFVLALDGIVYAVDEGEFILASIFLVLSLIGCYALYLHFYVKPIHSAPQGVSLASMRVHYKLVPVNDDDNDTSTHKNNSIDV
jgi:hypothetical protein